jgi:hypothetical protein
MTDSSQRSITPDENSTIIHIPTTGGLELQHASNSLLGPLDSRRPSEMSDSTYSLASSGRFTDDICMTPETDWSQTKALSPLQSPRQVHNDLIRTGSRSRASPLSHNNNRTSPYNLEGRQKRWSTGTFANSSPTKPPTSRSSSYFGRSPLNPHHALASVSSDHGVTTFAAPGQTLSYSQHRSPIPSNLLVGRSVFPDAPTTLASQFYMPSNTNHYHYHRAVEQNERPDIYVSIREEPCDPPEEDMNPSDPDMKPTKQEPRFPGDMYTPRWVRGTGNKREGYCGYCKPGRWLVLKNSGYWYDRLFTHGISNDTGRIFQEPLEMRQTEGNIDGWEGLCHSCNDWINLVSNKKKATSWFRHAKSVSSPCMYLS